MAEKGLKEGLFLTKAKPRSYPGSFCTPLMPAPRAQLSRTGITACLQHYSKIRQEYFQLQISSEARSGWTGDASHHPLGSSPVRFQGQQCRG